MLQIPNCIIYTGNLDGGIIEIINDDQDRSLIEATTFFTSDLARADKFFVSCNDWCFRLLLPDCYVDVVEEMAASKEVIVTRGVLKHFGGADSLELLFEDDGNTPLTLFLASESIDFIPDDRHRDCHGQPHKWSFRIYTSKGLIKTLPARYRKVKRLPCGRKWSE